MVIFPVISYIEYLGFHVLLGLHFFTTCLMFALFFLHFYTPHLVNICVN